MIGNKFNNKKGQVLLIAVMLLATVITVVMTVAFNSTNETKTAKLEEDSQKALAAAEAGIDAVIKQSVNSAPIRIDSLGGFNTQGISGTAQVISASKPSFVTPLLQKDEQYTLYLSNYPSLDQAWNGDLNIYVVSEVGQCPSLEVTVINNLNVQERYAYNTCSPALINNVTTVTVPVVTVIDSISFNYRTSDAIPVVNGRIAFIKVLNGRTKLGFQGTQGGFSHSLPAQGKMIESEARTTSGVVKRVQLFQSFPQIPSNFLTTSF
jgi:hypothetical protein